MNRPRILFVAATAMEVQSFLESCDCRRTKRFGHCLFHPGKGAWACLVTGPGGFNTAAGLGACLAEWVPDLVIDVGIAGVFPDAGPVIGDLALAESETYLHTGVGDDLPLPFDLIPGHNSTRTGLYPLDDKVGGACRGVLESQGGRALFSGPFLTVSAVTDSPEKAASLTAKQPYLMENMEGAAVAHVCRLHGLPMAEIRAVSNVTGDRDKRLWDIPAALGALNRALTCLKDVCPGK